MHVLSFNATDEDVLEAVESWIDALVEGSFESAFAMTAHDPERLWTPRLIQEVIAGYGLPDPNGVSRVTSRAAAVGRPSTREVDRVEAVPPNAIGMVWYALPLDGAWSDLTATFRLENGTAGQHLVLEEIHVM